MPGGKNNTQRIETLESQAASLAARLDVFDKVIENVSKLLEKYGDATEGHGSKITVIEQQLLIVDLRAAVGALSAIREELVAIRKDIESLQGWKADQKKEREETARRWWAFGPNITAVLIGGAITILGVLLNVALTFYLGKSK